MKLIHYLLIIFFSATLMFPIVAYDPVIDYYRLRKHYKWLIPDIYYCIHNEAKKYDNVSEDDLCAIIQYESGNYCRNDINKMKVVISFARAIGICQIMVFHHKGNKEDLYNPSLNIFYGARYYSQCLKRAGGNKKKALRFYNAGPYSVASNYRGWNGYVFPIIKKSNMSSLAYNEYYEIR